MGILGHFLTFSDILRHFGTFRDNSEDILTSWEHLHCFPSHFRPFSPVIGSLKKTRYGPTDGRTDGPTDRRTDRPSYRDAWTHLKIKDAGLTTLKERRERGELIQAFKTIRGLQRQYSTEMSGSSSRNSTQRGPAHGPPPASKEERAKIVLAS